MIPVPGAVLIVIGVIVSAVTKLHAVVLGRPVTVPALWLVALAVVLALAIMLLWLIRVMVRDGLRLRPVVVRT
jgi:hypothetical protein